MSLQFYALQYDTSPKYCCLGSETDETSHVCHRLIEGLPLAPNIPKSIEFGMSTHIGGIVAPDFVQNPFGYMVISQKMKTLFEQLGLLGSAEVMQCDVLNHKGKKAESDYYLVNILGTIDCLNVNKTLGPIDALEPQFFQWIDHLVIDLSKLNHSLHWFRVQCFPKLILVSNFLKEKMLKEKLTGMLFIPTGIEYQFS